MAEMPELNTVPKGSVDASEKAHAHRIGKINDYSRVKEKRKKEDEYKPVTKIDSYTYPLATITAATARALFSS